jgi:hypothetical protein
METIDCSKMAMVGVLGRSTVGRSSDSDEFPKWAVLQGLSPTFDKNTSVGRGKL